MLRVSVIAILFCLPASAFAQDHGGAEPTTPYAGLQNRPIAGLSQDDIAALREGREWGLALPAELNGIPGPVHLLELAAELHLSTEQIARIERLRDEMRADAIRVGDRLIAAEADLAAAFEGAAPDPATLKALVGAAETARRELRLVHLSRHLETPPILTAEQMRLYPTLRGYQEDPCAQIPESHDADLWRRHNGCI